VLRSKEQEVDLNVFEELSLIAEPTGILRALFCVEGIMLLFSFVFSHKSISSTFC
jgi:hypothetical protein